MTRVIRRHIRAATGRAGRLAAVVLALALSAPAHADRGPERVQELTRTLTSAKSEKERISAAVQLGKLRDARALKPLITGLADRSNVVRAVSAGALGFLGDPAALPALRRATGDPDKTVRRRATEAMAQLRQGGAIIGRNDPLANYKIDGRETPRLAPDKPSLFVVMKSTADKSITRVDPGTRRLRAGQVKSLMLKELGKNRQVTLEPATGEVLGLEPYAIDVTIVKLDRGETGPYVEIGCELRVAISNRRGKMISVMTGGAKVQVPKRTFRGEYEGQLRQEALENAVKSVHQDLITYLHKQPT